MRRIAVLVAAGLVLAAPAFALSPQTRAQRAVVREVLADHPVLKTSDSHSVSVHCQMLTRVLATCRWQAEGKDASNGDYVWSGKARVRLYRRSVDVTLSREHCAYDGSQTDYAYACD